MPSTPVYLDHHATTPVDPRVLEEMLPWFSEKFGNPASFNHVFGTEASDAVEQARKQIARLLNVDSREIIFTSGATEANNLALKGVISATPEGSELIVSEAEHRAVLDPASRLSREGYKTIKLPVNRYGQVSPDQIADTITDKTVLVSVMAANNEVGTINPIHEMGELCRKRGVLFHTDAVQAVGRIPFDLSSLPVDLASLTAHKLYGPKGIGALFIRREGTRIPIVPQIEGGGHERRLRSGTLPVPLIVGFGKACELAQAELEREQSRIGRLRNRLWEKLKERLEGLHLNGHPTERLAGNLNVSMESVDGDALMTSLTEIAVSSGSACSSADPEPSHVLRAMGVSDTLTRASIRFGLGRDTTEAEIDFAAEYLIEKVRQLRKARSN